MTFFDKFSLLAQRRGVSPRAVALALGFDPSAIAQWKRRGSRPNAATAAQLANYFEVPVEDMLDDTRDLSDEAPPAALEEDQPDANIISLPIQTAAALARREHGDTRAGQTSFEWHLANLRTMRDQVEALHPNNPAAAARHLDTLLASYIAGLDKPKKDD